jgi:glycosyltransferase involved in cell wall biosynthesis
VRISYLHGICVDNDAISNAIRDEISWLAAAGHDVRLFAYACDHADIPFTQVAGVNEIAFDGHFQSSDLVVFHFGVYYPLFDAIFVTPRKAKRVVVFHNVTPKEFIPAEQHEIIDKSFRQMANICFADHVVCVSQTNLTVLREAGIKVPATVLPLALHSNASLPLDKPSAAVGVLRLAFLGRFVRSKGPTEVLRALDAVLAARPETRLQLDMIGNLKFSFSTLLSELESTIATLRARYGERVRIEIHGNASEAKKHQILREADLFVLPSYHEGFCVPILEAMASGCQVVSYDNSNIPPIAGGLARLVPTGDVAALSRAVTEALDEIGSPAWSAPGGGYANYAARAAAYVAGFAPERAARRFLSFIRNVTS